MNPAEFLAYLQKQPAYRGQLVHVEELPARRARYGKLKRGLPETLVQALEQNGTTRLFKHQAQAINAVRAGAHVVIATGTASGKTLAYNIPALDAVLTDPRARALYLFPTKALAHDQLRTLTSLTKTISPRPQFGAYDGDTSRQARARLRAEAAILLTNPDMLHMGILPNHHLWADFFKNLKFVVIDEAHMYRGIFGSHVAVILRRLDRLCRHYCSRPQFIACSATISNPGEHVARLTGHTPQVIDDDGSPAGARLFALWNPPLVGPQKQVRRSGYAEAAALFASLVQQGIRNITFTKARSVAELIVKYARALLNRTRPELTGRVAAYRAGYLPEARRDIEQRLAVGQLIGVTATNALELGIDVGGLEAVVSVGYPGTSAGLWQQMGRAGRRKTRTRRDTSLAILVGLDNPLDQYFMRHPKELFARPPEHALIDPENIYVLLQQLPCAAVELPLTHQDEARFGAGFVSAMIELETAGAFVYQPQADNWMYMGRSYPAFEANIRSLGRKPVKLIDTTAEGHVLEVMDAGAAPVRVHPGAIYLHQGETYRVRKLDLNVREAGLVPVTVDYYTQPREINQVRIVQPLRQKAFRRMQACFGVVRVTRQVVGYRKIRHFSEKRSKEIALNLPPASFETMALWWELPPQWQSAVKRRGWRYAGGLQAVEHALAAILPLFAMCDRWDIGGHTVASGPETGAARIFIYDACPGGMGISEQGFAMLNNLWQRVLATIKECPCQNGCPGCIYSPKTGDRNDLLDKQAALWILESMLR